MSTIKYIDVKKDIESNNWSLISTEYKNLKSDLELKCPNNHIVKITYEDWRKSSNHECPICIKQPFIKLNEKNIRKKGQRILALDQSTHISGWSLYENGQLINYGSWEATEQKSTARISSIKAWVAYMIEKFSIDTLILEDIQLQKFTKEQGGEEVAVLTYKKLAHLQGVLKNYCYENGIIYDIVSPATWKSYNNIKGKTRSDQKKSAQLRVEAIFDIKASSDESDAILIGRYAAAQQNSMQLIQF